MSATPIRPDAPGMARVVPGPHAPPPLPFPGRPAGGGGGHVAPVAGPALVPDPRPGAPAPGGGNKPALTPVPGAIPGPARWQMRHWLTALSFLVAVAVPVALAAWYLFARAQDQYRSHLGFAIRGETAAAALDGMAGLAALAGASSSDSAILEEFLRSTALVTRIDARLGLRDRWRRSGDPVFSYAGASTEDLVRYWPRMVRLSTRPGSGLIGVSVAAFTPQDAAAIATAIRVESEGLVNDLSRAARDDALRQGTEELVRTIDRLTVARQAMATFRAESRIVDPAADLSGEMTVLGDLQRRLSEELVTLDMLRRDAAGLRASRNSDVAAARMSQTERRIAVIRDRITAEREKFGGLADRDYAQLITRFEALSVELDFAQQSYVAALAALDVARIEARRQARYLAVYETPQAAEASRSPRRAVILASVAAVAVLLWSVAVLGAYGLRDRM